MSRKSLSLFWTLALASSFGVALGLLLFRNESVVTVAMPDSDRATTALAAMAGAPDFVTSFEPTGNWLSLGVSAPTGGDPASAGGDAAGSTEDVEWLRFDRTQDFPRMLKRARGGEVISAKGLFRNVDLNPADVRLPEAVREFLLSLTSTYCADVERLRNEIRLLQNSEFDALVNGDATRKTSYNDYLQSLTTEERTSHDALALRAEQVKVQRLKAIGWTDAEIAKSIEDHPLTFDPQRIFGDGVVCFRAESGGVIRAAKIEDLPKTREADSFLTWLSIQYAERVVGAFVSAGCIGPDSVPKILLAAEASLSVSGNPKKKKKAKKE